MIKRIEHLGIAVNDLESARSVFDKLFDRSSYKEEIVESEFVKTLFYQLGESKIELLEATDPNSAIAKYLEKNKQGFHHVAFEVDDIEAELARLQSDGF